MILDLIIFDFDVIILSIIATTILITACSSVKIAHEFSFIFSISSIPRLSFFISFFSSSLHFQLRQGVNQDTKRRIRKTRSGVA